MAKEMMRPDTTIMRAITLSEGEGYYLTHKYPEAIAAWKEHLLYNPSSVATYYNIANAYAYLLKDEEQGRAYYQQFVEKAAEVDKPTEKLSEMIEKAKEMLRVYDLREKFKARKK
jgi:tetratricopeptide (TPR) repeat protein